MKYYVLLGDVNYECDAEIINADEFDDYPLRVGERVDEIPEIDLKLNISKELPNSIPNDYQFLFFDRKAREVLEQFEIDYLQYFDVKVDNKKSNTVSSEYKIVNVANVLDVIDREKSKLLIDDGDIIDIMDLQLDHKLISNELVFRLKGFYGLLVFREDLVVAFKNAKCTGLDFYDADGFSF